MKKQFYDVKKKKKVTREVVGKKTYGKGKKKRYALLGETSDGRKLTVFASKDSYDDADVPVAR